MNNKIKTVFATRLMPLLYVIFGLFVAYWVARLPVIFDLNRANHSLAGIACAMILIITFMIAHKKWNGDYE